MMQTSRPTGARLGFWRVLYEHRSLLLQMIRREISGRYSGSAIGILWVILNPLFMLVVYAFVFSVVFKARWGVDVNESKAQFGLVLFSGLIVHTFVAECLMRAPKVILDHSSYVKRVVFPLEILPIVLVGNALFHALMSFFVLVVGIFFLNGGMPWTALLLPVVLAPLFVGTLGLSWLLASLGVYARDIQQLVGMVVTASLFLTPIFYPISAVPERLRHWLYANPLTIFVEATRDVLVWGRIPNLGLIGVSYFAAAVVAGIGYWWFQKTRKGFADVL